MKVKLRSVLLTTFSVVCGGALYAAIVVTTENNQLTNIQRGSYGQVAAPPLSEVMRLASTDSLGVWKGNRGAVVPQRRLRDHDVPPTASQFQVKQPFHFPQPQFSRPDWELLQSDWVAELKAFLVKASGKQISMVTSTQEHQDVLVNWLISANIVARPPLENVLVLSLGGTLHEALVHRGIDSLLVTPEMVIDPDAGIDSPFSQVHIVRLTVLRLIVHYGFSVVNYDCDAIVLKNPQILFDKYRDADIIGTFGKGPQHLYFRWGVTLNTGVLLFRSNPKVEYYWEFMAQLANPTTDDQGNVNLALEQLNIQWMNLRPHNDIDNFHHEIYGICREQIIVVLLPFDIICRHTCTAGRRNEYYVWHALAIKENRTVENKMGQARVGNAWYLREDWMELETEMTGLDWLNHITDWSVIIR